MDDTGLLPSGLRWVDAGNAGPFTHEGTRSHIVGTRRVALVDPGPAIPAHVDALVAAVSGADTVTVLLTHPHADHTGATPDLVARLGGRASVAGTGLARTAEGADGSPGAVPDLPIRRLADGERVATDAGDLVAIATPGHAREHLVYHWPAEGAVFVGDLLLGHGDTTWVGAYPGCVRDYMASLDRLEALGARLLLPAHGPPIHDPAPRIARFRAHRRKRLAQVARLLEETPDLGTEELVAAIYGDVLPPAFVPAVRSSLAALLEHVREARS